MKLNLKGVAQQVAQRPQQNALQRVNSHILIVDDEEPNLVMLGRHLSQFYRVTTMTSAMEALKLIDSGKPEANFSVVISDQMMPGMNGVEFLTELKNRQVGATRILLTGFSALDTVVSAVNEAAIFRYVTKPVKIDQLMEVIKEADDQYAMKKENGRLIALVKDLLEKTANYEKQLPQQGQKQEEPSTWAPRQRDLVVLFADIRGFTAAARKADPEEVFKVLDRIFNPMHETIYDAGGVVDKLLGDGFMAIFGLTGETNIQTAVHATKLMCQRSSEILAKLPPPFDELRLSFGVAAGTVVVGMMGSIHRSEYAVIGDTANLAARLQEATKLALTTERGKQKFGEFKRSMALCSSNIQAVAGADFSLVELEGELHVRDFPDIRTIGVFSP